MTRRATGTFRIEGWDETAYGETGDGGKLTRAAVRQAFSGDIEGEGAVEWLMCYRPDQTADFVGLQRIVGQGAFSAPHGSSASITLDYDFE
jgi:hypothetical protein